MMSLSLPIEKAPEHYFFCSYGMNDLSRLESRN